MSLEKYTVGRLVVLSPRSTAYEAARAMEANHIGAVLVSENDQLVGMITDRDLALRVAGYGLDPIDQPLREVMSTDVATLPVDATEVDAAELMKIRHVRRIPVVREMKAVGLITLDDLILQRSVDPRILADIVAEQLSEPAALKDEGITRPLRPSRANSGQMGWERRERRRHNRARLAYNDLLTEVMRGPGLGSRERAETALFWVLSAILQRITPEEGEHLKAQLPILLVPRLEHVPQGPDRSISRTAIEQGLAKLLSFSSSDAANALHHVGKSLTKILSPGEVADVRDQLPADMKGILAA